MVEQAFSRYMASYLKSRENEFLVYSKLDNCDIVDEAVLQKIIQQYLEEQERF